MRLHKVRSWQGLMNWAIVCLLILMLSQNCFAQTELSLGTPYSDSLSAYGETKYYMVPVLAGTHLFVMLDKTSGWSSALYIRYGELPTTSQYDAMASWSASEQVLEIPTTQAGYYYLMVQSASSSGGSFTITARTSLDEITLDGSLYGSLSWNGDRAYYQINANSGHRLFTLLDKVSSFTSELYIRYGALPTTNQYDAKANQTSADQALDIAITQAGYYYVMVQAVSSFSSGSYNIRARTSLDEIVLGESVSGSLSSNWDRAYYQINVGVGQHLFTLLNKTSAWTSMLYIRYGALPTTSEYDAIAEYGSSDQAVDILTTKAGYYYVMVSGASGSYTITARTSLDEIALEKSVSGSLSWKGDGQYFAVQVPAEEHLYITLDKDTFWSSSLYIRSGALPTTSVYDDMESSNPAAQTVEIPFVTGGTIYYVMVRSETTTPGTYNISARSHLSAENPNIIYSYDNLNRLTGVTYPSGTSVTYTYDERGNRLSFSVQAGCFGGFGTDGDVDGSDLAGFIAEYGLTNCGTTNICKGDFDSSGTVDTADLIKFATIFGRLSCP